MPPDYMELAQVPKPREDFEHYGNATWTLPRVCQIDLDGYRYEKVPSFDVTLERWIDYLLTTEHGRRAWEELANERVSNATST